MPRELSGEPTRPPAARPAGQEASQDEYRRLVGALSAVSGYGLTVGGGTILTLWIWPRISPPLFAVVDTFT
jgi:hypothetical protein